MCHLVEDLKKNVGVIKRRSPNDMLIDVSKPQEKRQDLSGLIVSTIFEWSSPRKQKMLVFFNLDIQQAILQWSFLTQKGVSLEIDFMV